MEKVSFRLEDITQLSKGRCMVILILYIQSSLLFFLCTGQFFEFGECLGKEEVILQEIWQEAMGRYDRAMRYLMVDVLHETENPVENLVQSLEKMTTEGSQQTAQTIQKGNKPILFQTCIVTRCDHWL